MGWVLETIAIIMRGNAGCTSTKIGFSNAKWKRRFIRQQEWDCLKMLGKLVISGNGAVK